MIRLLLCILLAIPSLSEAKTFSVGYQYGMERYYPGAWSALDQGRRDAQKEWSKFANISWSGSSRPSIYIRPTSSSAVWGQVKGNSIYVTYSRKVWKTDAQWKDAKLWKSLFLHEYGHILVLPTGHCNNSVGGGKCLMTIQGGRQDKLCPTCLKKLQAKYGKPTVKSAVQADSVLVEAAKRFPGVRFHEGSRDDLLVGLAQDCADLLARRGQWLYWRNGHPGWNDRFAEIHSKLGMSGVEVTAMERPGEGDDVCHEAFYDWERSSGHWRVVSTPHAKYGDALASTKSGIWFAVIICAD